MTEIQNSKQVLVIEYCDLEFKYWDLNGFGHWILRFGIYLKFGAWDLGF